MEKSNNKVFTFLRRNAVYIVLAFCILAIGLSVTLILANRNKNNVAEQQNNVVQETPVTDPVQQTEPIPETTPTTPQTEPVVKARTFVLPVSDYNSVTEYTTAMVYNNTLKRFSAHTAVDFFAEEGTPVYAVSDGTVESVETTLIYGTTVVINHGDGIKSVYNSLFDGEKVFVGQKVKQGDVIGEVSCTNRQEYKEGAHLHFQMFENDVVIDPETYLTFERK